ncbi:hypothetical protein ACQKE5_09365 [Paenisporosarcina sp. NPDC076898]
MSYIQVLNSFTMEGNKQHLTEKELYLYCHMKREQHLSDDIKTTTSLTADFLLVPFNNKRDRNIKDVKEALVGLQNKSVITVSNQEGEIINDPKGNQSLRITIPKLKGEGFYQLPYLLFDSANDISDLYIHLTVAKWKGSFNCSLDRWASILMCSRNTAIQKVANAIEHKSIYCNVGDYLEQKKRDVNSYKIKPFSKEEKSNMTKKNEIQKATDKIHEGQENLTDYDEWLINETDIFNMYTDEEGTSVFPTYDDYEFYMEVVDNVKDRKPTALESKFLASAKKRIDRLKGNPQFKEEWEKAEELYYTKVNGIEQEVVSHEVKVETVIIQKPQYENLASMF